MRIDIDGLTEAELIDLYNRVGERLRFLDQVRAHSAMLQFSIGDRVTFVVDDNRAVKGVLTKYNKKTVTVLTEDGRRWNVSPTLLRKVPAVKTAEKGARVIALRGDD